MTLESRENPSVGIVGLGYVGVTLAAAMALKGFEVHGADVQPAVLDSLRRGKPHLFEPGVEDVFARCVNQNLFVAEELPESLDAAIISVSTPVDPVTHEPDLRNLAAAAAAVAKRCSPDTLVVVRSTVPVGASREVVLPALLAEWGSAHLVMAPERTIQGQALRELVELPQVVGALDAASLERGVRLFGRLCKQVVPVSSLETAELVKLGNNCHTDLIYAFGNEIAMLTERFGLDPLEVIRATNLDYPRPDLAKPGYVGGGCLSKDPYIMLSAAGRSGHAPGLVRAARTLNEQLPVHVAERVAAMMGAGTLAVLGWAYKGSPPTDDMRGTPIAAMMPVFEAAGIRVVGHDPLVPDAVIRAYGGDPVGLSTAFRTADAVLVITDHAEYRAVDIAQLLTDSPVRLVYDSWRILDPAAITSRGVRYAGIGYEAAA
ncbi:nucleotide sugar dehydrogenase [Kribbella solani]|uniref:UDP-N-acetyl-D-mannosaminuronic acid dehydrogenase n=1 Tax=Kribbella solani TaxID=236067 RepID=A0A841E3B2_9ACTN|nr:nucleotide sugar dehydrogenase [Kribbella solani]MBB5982877.1 UDP-N-acetyl-D-mannosaminuronic acid dehydrogenase [Kribbella solani]